MRFIIDFLCVDNMLTLKGEVKKWNCQGGETTF
jgi:hypothetical protein